ncbi:MAG: glycosyltransferase family 9 protein [Verrucomicrobia bacterium]|nr:glycosyltransferase family 9 protein [Verrucomicrobiota bacterium]
MKANPQRVIILRADHLGDMVLTTPLVLALSRQGYEVIIVGPAAWEPVWQGNPNGRYVTLQSLAPDWPRGLTRLARWLREQDPFALLVPHHSRQLLTASLLSGCRRRYCQLGRWWGRLTGHHCLPTRIRQTPRHMGLVWQDMVHQLGGSPVAPTPQLFLDAAEVDAMAYRIAHHVGEQGPLVVVHPFHGGSACNLDAGRYARMIAHLASRGARVIISGVASDRTRWPTRIQPDGAVWPAMGELRLRELMATIQLSAFLVVGNTGPLHIAHALGKPSVTVLCPQPTIGRALWGNPVAGSLDLTTVPASCPRLCGDASALCDMPTSPTDAELMAALDAALSAHGGSL